MQLTKHGAAGRQVRRVQADVIWVDDSALRSSFYLYDDQLVTDLPVLNCAVDLPESLVSALLALEPELVVLGTGQRQVFPPARTRAAFLAAGVGLEVMNNGAAARTLSVLRSEGRAVAALFVLPG